VNELAFRLDPALAQGLHDLADAQDRPPEEVAQEAVRRYLHEEGVIVRSVAQRIAREHAELLRRLGE